jgi:hypothetical protein
MKTGASLLLALGSLVASSAMAPARAAAEGVAVDATVYGYAVPDQSDFLMLVVPADWRWFHAEGRYNYESLHTGSAFLGLNASAGDKVKLTGTAMLGGVFGDVDGVAPAFRVTVTWWKLDFSSEGEYLIDAHDLDASFFYSWSELGLNPLHWLRVGAIGQRTRVVHNDLEIQRGLFVGFSPWPVVSFTFYELNLGWDSPTFVGAFGVHL